MKKAHITPVTPVHFRVVKHGPNTGEVFGVILTAEYTQDESGATEVATYFDVAGPTYSTLTWIRHHTRVAAASEYQALQAKMQKLVPALGDISPYPKLTDHYRRGLPSAA